MNPLTQPRGPRYALYGVAVPLIIALTARVATIPSEGLVTHPYRDIVGVWTDCRGHTAHAPSRTPVPHDTSVTFTIAQCDKQLADDLQGFDDALRRCITRPLPEGIEASLLDAEYQEGAGLVCGSHIQKYANAGNWAATCDGLLAWKYAGGKVVASIARRRQLDRDKLCREGYTHT